MPRLYARTVPKTAESATPSEARRLLAALRAQIDADPDAARERLLAAVRMAFPVDPPPRSDMLASIVDVCVQTVLDVHDFEKAVRRAERDGAEDLDEAIEIVADWTVRRERSRLARARGRSHA